MFPGQSILGNDGHVFIRLGPDTVQQQIHRTQASHAVDQFDAKERAALEFLLLGSIKLEVFDQIKQSRQQKTARAAGGIADRLPRLWSDHIDHRRNQRTRSKVLPGSAFDVFGVLLQQAFVGIAFHISGQAGPLVLVDQIDDQPPQFGRILNLVLSLSEDGSQHAGFLTEFLQRVPVVDFEFIAFQHQQIRPAITLRNQRRLIERWLRLFVGHLQEQQKRQLLNVVAIRQPVIAKDVAVVPELLNKGVRSTHQTLLIRSCIFCGAVQRRPYRLPSYLL